MCVGLFMTCLEKNHGRENIGTLEQWFLRILAPYLIPQTLFDHRLSETN